MNRLERYSVIILLAHISGIANSAVSFSGVVISLNNKESSSIYFSANILTLQIAVFVLGNLFQARNLPVFLSQLQINVFLSKLFVLFSIFYLYQLALVRIFVPACLY